MIQMTEYAVTIVSCNGFKSRELVRRINHPYADNPTRYSTWFWGRRTSKPLYGGFLSTLSGVARNHNSPHSDDFRLCLDILLPTHCPELLTRSVCRSALLEDVGERCWAFEQRKKASEQNSVSFISRSDSASIAVESAANNAHIPGISHLQSHTHHLRS